MNEQRITLEAVKECEFFGHLWKREDYVIAEYVLYRCQWCKCSRWKKKKEANG